MIPKSKQPRLEPKPIKAKGYYDEYGDLHGIVWMRSALKRSPKKATPIYIIPCAKDLVKGKI